MPHPEAMWTVRAVAICAFALTAPGCGAAHDGRTDTAQVLPRDSFPEGSRASFTVDAHCGVEYTVIDGYTWRTRLRDDGNSNPPRGWPQRIEGVLTRPSHNRAVFVSTQIPVTLVFKPAPDAVWSCM
jgi:hypothetical protein